MIDSYCSIIALTKSALCVRISAHLTGIDVEVIGSSTSFILARVSAPFMSNTTRLCTEHTLTAVFWPVAVGRPLQRLSPRIDSDC